MRSDDGVQPVEERSGSGASSTSQEPADPPSPDVDGAAPEPPPRAALEIDEARRRRIRPWAIVGAAVVVIVTGGVALSYTSLFGAREVQVEGADHLAPRQVMRLAQVGLGTNVVHLDESVAEARLEGEAWILDATVETALPGTIVVSVQERTPVMLLVTDDARRWVASDGTDLGRAPRTVLLPEVTLAQGVRDPHAIPAAGEVIRAMAPALRTRVDSITVAADGAVDLVADRDVEVRYGSVRDTAAKAQALRAILEFADAEGRGLLSIDVSAPAAPTARFAGSGVPVSIPDPSADEPD